MTWASVHNCPQAKGGGKLSGHNCANKALPMSIILEVKLELY